MCNVGSKPCTKALPVRVVFNAFKASFFYDSYTEIDDVNLKGTLWTFKQRLAIGLKLRVCCGISIVLQLTSSYKALSGYVLLQDWNVKRTSILDLNKAIFDKKKK